MIDLEWLGGVSDDKGTKEGDGVKPVILHSLVQSKLMGYNSQYKMLLHSCLLFTFHPQRIRGVLRPAHISGDNLSNIETQGH